MSWVWNYTMTRHTRTIKAYAIIRWTMARFSFRLTQTSAVKPLNSSCVRLLQQILQVWYTPRHLKKWLTVLSQCSIDRNYLSHRNLIMGYNSIYMSLETIVLKITHVKTTPKLIQANGEVEPQNASILKHIQTELDWQKELRQYVTVYRGTAHNTTGKVHQNTCSTGRWEPNYQKSHLHRWIWMYVANMQNRKGNTGCMLINSKKQIIQMWILDIKSWLDKRMWIR